MFWLVFARCHRLQKNVLKTQRFLVAQCEVDQPVVCTNRSSFFAISIRVVTILGRLCARACACMGGHVRAFTRTPSSWFHSKTFKNTNVGADDKLGSRPQHLPWPVFVVCHFQAKISFFFTKNVRTVMKTMKVCQILGETCWDMPGFSFFTRVFPKISSKNGGKPCNPNQ